MSLGQLIFQAVKRCWRSLMNELTRVFELDVPSAVPTENTQLLVNRSIAVVVVIVAVVATFLPGEKTILRTIANALFGIAAGLWADKDQSEQKALG